MNNKILQLQKNAQAQTYGVEIEMNNITRENAAKVAAEFFGTGRYEYTGYVDGYQTWTAFDAEGRAWKFSRDVSIHGIDAEKTELISPPLRYQDMETLQELVRRLRKAGGRSDDSRGCGLHIHAGLEAIDGTCHTPQSIRNLANLIAANEDLIIAIVGITSPDRIDHYCKPVDPDFIERLNKRAPKNTTWETLAQDWYGTKEKDELNRCMAEKYSESRYRLLNLHPTMQWMNGYRGKYCKGTIELRGYQFDKPSNGRMNGLNSGQLRAYVLFTLHLSAYAKLSKSISPRRGQRDNSKFAMRTFLCRLGFIGDEYKNVRKWLMRNLEGNGAWRFGKPTA